LFTRLKFILTVGGASIDGKTNALEKLWSNANIDNLMKRINIRATRSGGGELQHSWTTRPGLALNNASVFIDDKSVDFSDFTYEKGQYSHKQLKGEHQLAWYIKTNPKLMNPKLTDKEEQEIKECDLKYFPKLPLGNYKDVPSGQVIARQVELTEKIELNHDNIFAKPNEDGPVDSDDDLERMEREFLESGKSGKSMKPVSFRRTWPYFEKFLKEGQRKNEYKVMAQTRVDWEKIRQCTSLACAWKLTYAKPSTRPGVEEETLPAWTCRRSILYEKNEAGVWSQVAESGPAMTERLVELYPRN